MEKENKELEEFKQNPLKKITEVARKKTEWLKSFQELKVYDMDDHLSLPNKSNNIEIL